MPGFAGLIDWYLLCFILIVVGLVISFLFVDFVVGLLCLCVGFGFICVLLEFCVLGIVATCLF